MLISFGKVWVAKIVQNIEPGSLVLYKISHLFYACRIVIIKSQNFWFSVNGSNWKIRILMLSYFCGLSIFKINRIWNSGIWILYNKGVHKTKDTPVVELMRDLSNFRYIKILLIFPVDTSKILIKNLPLGHYFLGKLN